ncbi:pilus assembly PilX family protein [Microbulbifer rhizosphaerae]|uniref:Type IV pilus assembly protein PilX n=1 Tax=Microbulbifer rhizosphaerae TaxID=1562603 RepID=A0A7W4Z8K4_9GAMM|nr:PilX N-terminal domain-containing pilus assembly protein [Microbulbifer rhizosphaerae]MBB3060641.1 type IV pilus assembly protein PilX [Microbulbifer rhizosphaerae]
MNRQRGAVLIVSLIILLVLTMMGISGARAVLLGERMTAASRDAKIALEVAESMVRQAEKHIDGLDNTSTFGDTGWCRTQGKGPADIFSEDTWKDTYAPKRNSTLEGPDGLLKGRVFIEMFGRASDDSDTTDVDLSGNKPAIDFEDVEVFRIVARGEGPGGTKRILVTLYGKSM